MADILQRYADRILGVLSCYDRVIIHGRIPEIAYAKGMEMYLRDFPKFAHGRSVGRVVSRMKHRPRSSSMK